MIVVFNADETVTLTMTPDELGSLRYGLDAGAEKLRSTASFMKAMKDTETKNARETADRVSAVNTALEAAVQAAIRG